MAAAGVAQVGLWRSSSISNSNPSREQESINDESSFSDEGHNDEVDDNAKDEPFVE